MGFLQVLGSLAIERRGKWRAKKKIAPHEEILVYFSDIHTLEPVLLLNELVKPIP